MHNAELRNPYTSPSIIRVIKSKMLRCAGYVTRMRGMRIE